MKYSDGIKNVDYIQKPLSQIWFKGFFVLISDWTKTFFSLKLSLLKFEFLISLFLFFLKIIPDFFDSDD